MFKKIFLKVLCFALIFSFIPVTGCSKFDDFREDLESRMDRKRDERKEEDGRSFSTSHDFEDYYSKEIKKALQDKKKSSLKDLFCETVLENTYDMDEGLDYVLELEDWSGFSFSNGNNSSRKEYGGDGHWEFVFCRMDLLKGDVRYRLFYSGYSTFVGKVDGKNQTVKENLGLANFYIAKPDSEGNIKTNVYNAINGIHHPGREKLESLAYTVLDTYESKNKDGSYIDTMTDDAIGSIMTDNLRKSADKDELEAFIRFIRLGSMSKKGAYFFFLKKSGNDIILTNVVHFELKDHCLTMLIKNGRIDGVTFSDDENQDKPGSGKIKGFADKVE